MKLRILFLAAGLCAVRVDASCVVPYLEPASKLSRTAKSVLAVDLDGDARPDVAAQDGTSVFVSLNDGHGVLGAPSVVREGPVSSRLHAADFNGDGKADLAFTNAASLVVLPGNGNGTFGAAVTSNLTSAPSFLAAAEFDAGETVDVVAVDAGPSLVLLTNDGTGAFTESTHLALAGAVTALDANDFDGDGRMDVIAVNSSTSASDVLWGLGDGTFERGAIRGAGSVNLHSKDMNGDGLADLVAAREFYTLGVIRNLGNRAFNDALSYDTDVRAGDALPADLTGDGIADVFVTSNEYCSSLTFTGTGIGTLSNARNQGIECYQVNQTGSAAALGDYDGDGRTDVALAQRFYVPSDDTVQVLRNRCGDTDMIATPKPPVISVGQTADVEVSVRAPASQWQPMVATGTVTLREGDAVLASNSVTASTARFTLEGLAAGTHTFVAEYSGDDQYDEAAVTFDVRVTRETTTTAMSIAPSAGEYGVRPEITVRVSSSDGTTPTGNIHFTIDGVSGNTDRPAPALFYAPSDMGTYTYAAQFLGDASHPPSSVTRTFTIGKQTPAVTFDAAYAVAGQERPSTIRVVPHGTVSNYPTGFVTLTAEGFETTLSYDGSGAGVVIPAMTAGRDELTIAYSGDGHYAARETLLPFVCFPPASGSVDARGDASGIRVGWFAQQEYESVVAKRPAEAWAAARYVGSSSARYAAQADDRAAEEETVYQYRLQSAFDHTATSAVDIGMRISFTDDPLLPGTRVRAVHLQEIVRAANIVRAAAGLSPVALTISSGSLIDAQRIVRLRDAIAEARSALGASAFPFSNAISPGDTIRAIDVRELREALR